MLESTPFNLVLVAAKIQVASFVRIPGETERLFWQIDSWLDSLFTDGIGSFDKTAFSSESCISVVGRVLSLMHPNCAFLRIDILVSLIEIVVIFNL